MRGTCVQERQEIKKPARNYFKSPCLESAQKLVWLKTTIASAFLCSLGLSWRLWISSRLFPLSPVGGFPPLIPFPFDYIFFFVLLGILLTIVALPRPRKFVLPALVVAGLLGLWDQTRWQPWFYQYLFMLAAIGFYAWGKLETQKPETRNRNIALNACRLIVICTYFWSGLQKLNANFIHETWPDIAGSLLHFLPRAAAKLPPILILIVPLLEIAAGLGLVTRKYRNAAVVLAVCTHIFILVLLFSSGENTVVWPWNIAMALLVVILFWQDQETSPRTMIPANTFQVLVVLLFGVLPALSFVDLWDSYLSAALYSGNTDQAVIYVTPAVVERLPAAIHPYIWQNSQPYFLDINRWAYGELNVPVYPEPRIYRKVAEQICQYAGDASGDVKLRIKQKPNPLTGLRKSEYYDCDHLSEIP